MDGCSAHISLAIVEEARARNIILVKLPPNSTHILQVLDVTVFGPSKSAWTEVIRQWSRQSRFKNVTKSVFPALLSKLFDSMVEKPDNLVSGFRTTGIWPLNKKKILDKVEERGVYRAANEIPTNPSEQQNADVNEASVSSATDANPGSSTTDQSAELISAVREVLVPAQDSFTKNAIQNSKNRTRVKKKFAEIITSDEAISAMRSKESSKSTKKGKGKKTRKNEEQSDDSDNQPIITRYFKKTS
ncbi:unnamed protein product, partial [Meganyctiphanes norvegica]